VLRVAANVVVLVEACTHKKKKPSYSAAATPVLSCCPPKFNPKLIEKLSDEILIYCIVRRRPGLR